MGGYTRRAVVPPMIAPRFDRMHLEVDADGTC
jgi:hypothetical protein